MTSLLKDLIEKSGKKTSVHYNGKENRVRFDDSFGKKKVELATKFIGDDENSLALSKKHENI